MNWNSSGHVSLDHGGVVCGEWHTWRRVRVVVRKGHPGFEISAMIEGVRVEDHERDIPSHDVFLIELCTISTVFHIILAEPSLTSMLTHFSLERALYSFMRIRSAMTTTESR